MRIDSAVNNVSKMLFRIFEGFISMNFVNYRIVKISSGNYTLFNFTHVQVVVNGREKFTIEAIIVNQCRCQGAR